MTQMRKRTTGKVKAERARGSRHGSRGRGRSRYYRERRRANQEREIDEAAAASHSTTGFDLGDKDTGPRQVKLKSYPQDSFGTQKRAFHHSWFEKHNWLE